MHLLFRERFLRGRSVKKDKNEEKKEKMKKMKKKMKKRENSDTK